MDDEIIITETERKVRFRVETRFGPYSDAVTIPIAEIEQWSDERIAAEKQRRVDNWIAVLTTPPADEGSAGEGG